MKGLPIQSYSSATPRLLFGLDNWRLCMVTDIREGGINEPIANKTRLGWLIAGPFSKQPGHAVLHHFHICECDRDDSELNNLVKKFYALDNYGANKIDQILESDEVNRSRELLKRTTIKLDGRYETGLLWRYDKFELPDSWKMAYNRLICLENKMKREPDLAANVKKQICEYVGKGYVRKLSASEARIRSSRTWYLPIFTVRNPNKPQKIRLVWDAAAKVGNVSLNSMLMKGPDMMTSLVEVLWRFRQRIIAVTGDIAEMFHQVKIKESDRQSQRFLWRDGNTNRTPDVYEMTVMTFGSTCSPCSAMYVKNSNALRFQNSHPTAVNAIIHNHYVDDWLESVDSEAEAVHLALEVKNIHSQAGFHIRNWRSNSPTVLRALGGQSEDRTKCFDGEQPEKILGMLWDSSSDVFCYQFNRTRMGGDIINGMRRPTKRQVLRTLMMMFDPLGFIGNFLIHLKILMQDIWRSGVKWDEPIKDAEYDRWKKWLQILPIIERVRIPRCYLSSSSRNASSIQLHVFVDASEAAYCAVAYFRNESRETVDCKLVGSKTKVAPLKCTSIPRLELQAAVLGARLKSTILKAHNYRVSKVFLWSDSKTAISWIRSNQRRYKQYVALRISEILELTDVSEWRWIPSGDNVADDGTKDKGCNSLSQSSRWFVGPQFLSSPETQWPTDNFTLDDDNEVYPMNLHLEKFKQPSEVPELSRCRSWNMVIRVQVRVLRFAFNMTSKKHNLLRRYGSITLAERNEAIAILLRMVQWSAYGDEISLLRSDSIAVEKRRPIFKLSPHLGEYGVLRQRR